MTERKPAKARRRGLHAPATASSRSKSSSEPSLVVGIGASAGGLEAFRKFLSHMPADSGMAFVLVQHLDPHHKSMLAELLSRFTAMKVVQAEDGLRVVANCVFVIPPDATLTIQGGVLRVVKPAPAREHRRPIDTFFASLADDRGETAVCIVLSGTGSDGAQGLTAIKEHGGLSLAQAEFDSTAMSGMPHSAAATGMVDHVIPVEEMAATLMEYQGHLVKVSGHKDADGTRRDTTGHLATISNVLRAATGHDFSQYKHSTLVRRVQRRMQVLRIDTTPAFIERLKKEPREVELLFREFLIGVTQFFRDSDAFDALAKTVLPKLLGDKKPDDRVRVWVPGCATGEEVYSIAIALREEMERQGVAPAVQIFGTDIDAAAVAFARAARFRKPMIGLSPERVERWFGSDGEYFWPVKEVRDMCVFSVHSLVKDPPFSKLDLISCRNLLIYLDAPLQDRVIRTFHYALQPEAYLFLGQSEGVTRNSKLFATIDKKHRIFQRNEAPASSLPSYSLTAPTLPPPASTVSRPATQTRDWIESAARRVMEKHSPAYVVIDKNLEILRFSGGEVGRYLEPSPGIANFSLIGIVRKTLRPTVRSAVQKASAEKTSVTTKGVAVRIDGKNRMVQLIVEPMSNGEAQTDLFVVAFHDAASQEKAAETEAPHPDLPALEQELQTTRAQLQAAIDELESSNEEMKSANEEFQSVNEELQSSNEELETAKEEMQSVNEELQTVNAEMRAKNEKLTQLNSDLKNLLDSTQIATIFLDNSLRIKNFTPGMTDLFHLRDSDRGRPITDIVARVGYQDLSSDVKKVLCTLSVVEHEVRLAEDDATTFIMRIRPYRTVDNVIDGVVITFVDVSEHMRYEETRARLSAIVDSSEDAIVGHTLDGVISSWNGGAERLFGFAAKEALGKPVSMLLPADQVDETPHILEMLRRGERVEHFEVDRLRKDGTRIDVSLTISPVKDADGNMIAASTIAREFTKRKIADDHKNLLIGELDHRVKNILMIVTSLIGQTLKTAESPEAFAEVIEGRIQALSRVHKLLTQSNWDRALLRDVLEGELAPYRTTAGENIAFGGSANIVLMPKATLALTMALHELATNAMKYGSLSAPGGRIDVSWDVKSEADGLRLVIEWIESGGPPVKTPVRQGFGSHLIERTMAYDLGARVRREFRREGLLCKIEFPLTEGTGSMQPESAVEK